jgi:Cyclic nucleotide-binding domain
MLRPGVPDSWQASHADSGDMTIDRSPLIIPGQRGISDAAAFWEMLEAAEREAYRSMALHRTFAAGMRLLKAGERADHVIVILSGWAKIVVEEGGLERVLAERGPGQLVGERAALQINVHSASVIALETVQALVVRAADFAAFVAAHPAALNRAECQLYDQFTAPPVPSRRLRPVPVKLATGPNGPRGHSHSDRPAPRTQPLNGENCTIILSDVAGFGAHKRTDGDRRIIREALLSITHTALQDLPDVWSWDDRGDGLLTVIPPSVPTARIVEQLHRELPVALEEHNRIHHEEARIDLRVAVGVGPVASDKMGVSGEAIIVTARLVEAPALKTAMETSRASLGVIASTFIYETVIRHTKTLRGYSEVQVNVKESSLVAWMKLFETTPATDVNHAVAS